MRTTSSKWVMKAAGTGAIALLLATPSFAQSRGDWNRNNDYNQRTESRNDGNYRNNNNYRENQRVTETGTIRSFSRERDGYRVELDRGQTFWVPQATFGNRARELRTGISISLGGIFRGGTIYADAVTWPGNAVYRSNFVRGVVDRIDYRTRTIWLRDDASGRLIAADMNGRREFAEMRGLRRGDRVELTGQWIRGGVFDVANLNMVRGRRY
jgi:hypothetical protein